jgi:hypothetical protein
VYWIQHVFHFSLQLLFQIVFDPINVQLVTLEMRAEKYRLYRTRATRSPLGSMTGRRGWSYYTCALHLFLFQTHSTPVDPVVQCTVAEVDACFVKEYITGVHAHPTPSGLLVARYQYVFMHNVRYWCFHRNFAPAYWLQKKRKDRVKNMGPFAAQQHDALPF